MARFNDFAVEQAPARVKIVGNTEVLHNQTIVVVTSLVLDFDKKLTSAMLETALTQANMGIAVTQEKATSCMKLGLNKAAIYSSLEIKTIIELISSSIYYEMGVDGTESLVYDLKMCVLDLREALLPLATGDYADTNKIRKLD